MPVNIIIIIIMYYLCATCRFNGRVDRTSTNSALTHQVLTHQVKLRKVCISTCRNSAIVSSNSLLTVTAADGKEKYHFLYLI